MAAFVRGCICLPYDNQLQPWLPPTPAGASQLFPDLGLSLSWDSTSIRDVGAAAAEQVACSGHFLPGQGLHSSQRLPPGCAA